MITATNLPSSSMRISRVSEVEKAVMKLNAQGVYPSESNVSKLISKPGNFREKEVRDALKKARQKLGIKI
ncbi:MAG: hypothetical protein QNJ55_28920 [Xenococcus sp. MO_188.B8]|nr:hypothetical protein [Xenococcus sp. MO_188.B8]